MFIGKEVVDEDQDGYGGDRVYVVAIYVNDQPSANGTNGYYIFDGTWNSLQNTASSGIITLDFTNASKQTGPSGSTTVTCGSNPRDWFFAENSLADARTAFEQCAVSEETDVVGLTNLNTTGYMFNINF